MDVYINVSVHVQTHQCIHTDTQIYLQTCIDQKDQALFVNDY